VCVYSDANRDRDRTPGATVTDTRTDRVAELAAAMTALEPPAIRLARARVEHARRDLAVLLRGGSPQRLVQAGRYRLERMQRELVDAWRDVLHPPMPVG
jgi:DNA-binding GntR family transcriptional regulator